MTAFINALVIMFAWLPSWAAVIVLSFLSLMLGIMIFKVVTFVIDAIPFL